METRKAQAKDTTGIAKVCAAGNWETYRGLLPEQEIERVIEKFYNEQRILNEIENTNQKWNGWFVALDEGVVVGAGGGGFTFQYEELAYDMPENSGHRSVRYMREF